MERKMYNQDQESPDYWFNHGISTLEEGKFDEAEAAFKQTIRLCPDFIEAHLNLGNLLYNSGRTTEALAAYHQAISINPLYDKANYNLGNLLFNSGNLTEAEAAYRQALHANPEHGNAFSNLGRLLFRLGRYDEARVTYRQALSIMPDSAELHYNLGDTFLYLNRLEEAARSYLQAITLQPDYAEAYNSLGTTLGLLLRLEQAETAFRHAIACRPDYLMAYNNLLLTMQYIHGLNSDYTFNETLSFGRQLELSCRKRFNHDNDQNPDRRLKIGIISGNLCSHPVGYFLEAILQYLDPQSVSLHAYANQPEKDSLSDKLALYFDSWSMVQEHTDDELAVQINRDKIDILVDLAGHTAGNRLSVFTGKPAPIQVTWLGYPNTTGLRSMDYIIADPITVPRHDEKFYSEKVWRLPDSYICFTPPDMDLKVNPLPAVQNGYITFGSFNNPVKLNDTVMDSWARILLAVPNSILLIRLRQGLDRTASQCNAFRQRFASHGVDPSRLHFEGTVASRYELINAYKKIDIALDPFPYNGTTTTCEAAWMGVPTLTMSMPRGIYSYNGELIMKSVGLGEWATNSVKGYIATAIQMTSDIDQLAKTRSGLRSRLLASPLCDAPRFADNLQNAFREMWQIWCPLPISNKQ